MKNYHVYGVGNALVDTEYEVADDFLAEALIEKGHMTLIDDETRVRLKGQLDGRYEAKKHSGGGSAGNTMVAICRFGGRAFYSCKVADDDLGMFYMDDLHGAGVVSNLGSVKHDGVTGQCLVLITPDAERTMTTYLGITQSFSGAELEPDAIRESEYLYIEGYLASSESGRQAAVEARRIARAAGTRVSISLSDPSMTEYFRDALEEMMGGKADLLFCNESEACQWTGKADLDAAAEALKESTSTYALTLGADGALIWDGRILNRIPAVPTEAVDTNGAGDMYAGAFLYGITHGYTFESAAALASRASSKLVSSFGARLDEETQQKILLQHRSSEES